jgi:hypothetical protein
VQSSVHGNPKKKSPFSFRQKRALVITGARLFSGICYAPAS